MSDFSSLYLTFFIAYSFSLNPVHAQGFGNTVTLYDAIVDLPVSNLEKSAVFSNDNKYLVFFNEDQTELQSISTKTGKITTLFDAVNLGLLFITRSIEKAIKISPDGNTVIFLSIVTTGQKSETAIFTVPIDGSSQARRLTFSNNDSGNVIEFEVTPDGKHIVFLGDFENKIEIYSIEINSPYNAIKLNQNFISGGNVSSACQFSSEFKISPDSQTVVYQANATKRDEFNIYTVPIRRETEPTQLNVPIETFSDGVNCDTDEATRVPTEGILEYEFLKDSSSIIYRVLEKNQNGQQSVYRISSQGGTNHLLYKTPAPRFTDSMRFFISQNDQYVVIKTSEAMFDSNAPLGFSGVDKILAISLSQERDKTIYNSTEFATILIKGISDDNRLVYSVDNEIFVSSLNNENTLSLIEGTSFFDLVLSPDNSSVLFLSDAFSQSKRVSLFRIFLNGGSLIFEGQPLIANGDIINFKLSDNGSQLVFLADREVNNKFELYTKKSEAGLGTEKVNMPLQDDSDVIDYLISPDGSFIAYQTYRTNSRGQGNLVTFITKTPQTEDLDGFCFPIKVKQNKLSVICI